MDDTKKTLSLKSTETESQTFLHFKNNNEVRDAVALLLAFGCITLDEAKAIDKKFPRIENAAS